MSSAIAALSAANAPAAPGTDTPGAAEAQPIASVDDLDEAALLDAAYDRVSLGALQTIDDMTPRAREVVFARGPRARR